MRPPRFSPEFESCRRLAEAQNLPLVEIYEAARQAYQSSPVKARVGKRGKEAGAHPT